MPLYWVTDTEGAGYCVRAECMTAATEAFRAKVGEDPEVISLAADDDVELIGFDALDAIAAEVRRPGAVSAVAEDGVA